MEKVSLNIFNIVSMLSIFASMLFVFQLLFLKKRNTTTRYFSTYLMIISTIVVFFLIVDLDYPKIAIGMLPLFMFVVLSLGPVLWLTVSNVVGAKKNKIIKHLSVPIAVGVIFVVLLLIVVLLKDEPSGEVFQDLLTIITTITLTLVFVLQNGFYIYQSLKLYKSHLKRVEEVFSYTEQVDLGWLKLLVYGYVLFVLFLVLSNILDNFWSELLFHFILFVYIIFSGYNALTHKPVFTAKEDEREDEEKEEQNVKVLVDMKSALFVELKSQLQLAMVKDKLFLNDSLTIHYLATTLNTNSKYLSQLINTEFNKSFVVFINEFRIDESKKLLLNDVNKHLTIESIGYEAGFKSKSAFNTAFKKNTGETPSSFLNKAK